MTDTGPRVTIHGSLLSTWTRTVAMVCAEKGFDYEVVAPTTESLARLHPFRRLPVVEVGGQVLFESLAITGHLDEARPDPPLQPTDPAARDAMRMWLSVCADYVFRDVVRTVPRDRPASDEERATARGTLERVEALVGDGEFLTGARLTLADLCLAPQIANCREKAADLLEGLPALAAWSAGIDARPSFAATTYDAAAELVRMRDLRR